MKKTILSLVLILILIASILVLTGCEENKTENGTETETKSKSISKLVGTWSHVSDVVESIYVFNEDYTGSYSSGSPATTFTYEDTATELTLLFNGNPEPRKYNYRLEDNKFIIEETPGVEVEYVKK